MKGRVALAALAVLLVADAVSAETVRVTADKVNLRSQPSATGSVMATVEKGAILEVLERSGDWMKVRTGAGVEGFIHSVLVEPAAGVAAPPPTSPPAQPVASPEPQAPKPSPPPRSTVASSASTAGRNDTLGIGVCLGGYSFGVGGGLRVWSSDRLGFNACVDHYSIGLGDQFSSFNSSVLQVSPGVFFRLREPERTTDTTFTPYVGGGVSITRSSIDSSFVGVPLLDYSATSFGGFGLVGVELRFGTAPIGISAAFGY